MAQIREIRDGWNPTLCCHFILCIDTTHWFTAFQMVCSALSLSGYCANINSSFTVCLENIYRRSTTFCGLIFTSSSTLLLTYPYSDQFITLRKKTMCWPLSFSTSTHVPCPVCHIQYVSSSLVVLIIIQVILKLDIKSAHIRR